MGDAIQSVIATGKQTATDLWRWRDKNRLVPRIVTWVYPTRVPTKAPYGSGVVTINSRSANVSPDGTFFVQNIPFITAPVRVEAVCTLEGLTLYGASDYVSLAFQGTVQGGRVATSEDVGVRGAGHTLYDSCVITPECRRTGTDELHVCDDDCFEIGCDV